MTFNIDSIPFTGDCPHNTKRRNTMKKKVLIALVVMLVLAVTASVAWADPAVWDVYEGDSIQAAIDGASDGDTIYVHAGTYDESIVIDGVDVSLIAVGSVTIAPTSACSDHKDVIQVYNSVATIEGFTIDANFSVSGCLGGIYARGHPAYGEGDVDVIVKNNTVFNYGKNGITVNCELATGEISGNNVTGGQIGPYAQNGIQFGYGATGQVMRNTVDSNWYMGDDWTASGVLVFESDGVIVQNNRIRNSQTGVAIESWCWLAPSADNNKVVGNIIQDAKYGVSVAAYGWAYSSCDASADNNKVTNNKITATDGETGIYIGTWVAEGYEFDPSAHNNKVVRNKIDGYKDEKIVDEGTATKVHGNVPIF